MNMTGARGARTIFCGTLLVIILRPVVGVLPLSPLAQTENGPVRGRLQKSSSGSTAAWWGIPFAEPPVGKLRLRTPVPLRSRWTKPRDALQVPPSCEDHEDCLYLNVYAPVHSLANGSVPLPVMVWIYGGGFNAGNNYFAGLYDGTHLSEHHDVVVVAMNYRLGNLGFMALDALRRENAANSTGNYGVQDQRLALQWVQANIKSFGGDPNRVTIFGESAGGMSVMWHLVNPLSKGLFHAAIMESGNSGLSYFFQHYLDATAYHEDTARILGCPSSLGAEGQLSCLRALPMNSILHGAGSEESQQREVQPKKLRPRHHSPIYPVMPVGPVIDGTEAGLPDTPIKMVEAGRFNRVPLIAGANEDGGTVFEPMLPQCIPGAKWPATLFNSTHKVLAYLFRDNVSKVTAVYNGTEYTSTHFPADALLSRMLRDLVFMCPLRKLLAAWARYELPAYMYVFHFNYGTLVDRVTHLGDFHGGEVPFVFRNWLKLVRAIDVTESSQEMANIMSCRWASFAYLHDPNGGPKESKWLKNCKEVSRRYSVWPRFSQESRLFYYLQNRPQVRSILADNMYPDDPFPRDPKCDLWDTMAANLPWIQSEVEGRETTIVV
mmetsp:Transcript_107457/g.213377  ORF Transcript_107457/g.213377 Transcript_107457/m.213377 type:complete len:605 (+) Transcript_107457:121-1935(+)